MSYGTTITRDLSLTGVQTVSLPFKVKSLYAVYAVMGTSYSGISIFSENGYQRTLFVRDTPNWSLDASIVRVETTQGSVYAQGKIQNITDTGFEIDWTKTGEPTDTVTINLTAISHGEG